MSVAWGSDVAASREALRLIGEFGGPEALEGLFYFLDSSLTGISSEAAIAIGRIDGQEAVDRALEIFRTGRNRSRAQAARALGELRAREAANDLLTAVLNGSEDIWVRYYALEALGWCGNEGMVPQIVSIMENPDSDPRLVRIGIEALGALGGETVLEIYDRIIAGDEHFNLDRTGGQTALVSCIAGLGKMNSDESRERLRSILKSAEEDNLDVIIGVIRALGNVGTPDDIGTIRALESEIPFLGEPSDEAIGSIGTRFPSSGQVDN
jgi:HEAT repeat protein